MGAGVRCEMLTLMRFLTEPGEWTISLVDGSTVCVWADGYETVEAHHDFGLLIDTEGAPLSMPISSRTPSDPHRVVVSVARFPVAAVSKIRGG